jgi:hypothetical protein
MNKFFNIDGIDSKELMPWTMKKMGFRKRPAMFESLQDILFSSEVAGGVIKVEKGFLSDHASIPQAVNWYLTNDDPRISAGAWVHDKICLRKGHITLEDGRQIYLSHRQAAKVLIEAMKVLGARKPQMFIVYHLVCRFGPKWKGETRTERIIKG